MSELDNGNFSEGLLLIMHGLAISGKEEFNFAHDLSLPGCLVIFNIKFWIIQGHLPHFNEIFQAHDLIFYGHVSNIHQWQFLSPCHLILHREFTFLMEKNFHLQSEKHT